MSVFSSSVVLVISLNCDLASQFSHYKNHFALIQTVISLIVLINNNNNGPLSDEAHSLIAEIGRRATLRTADPR